MQPSDVGDHHRAFVGHRLRLGLRHWISRYISLVRAPIRRGESSTWQPAPAPTDPVGFAADQFVLPEHTTRLSRLANPHSRDRRIVFDEEPHVYYVDGIPTSWSVTGLVHKFCTDFDAPEAIRMMRRSRNWPRPQYSTACPLKRQLCGLLAANAWHESDARRPDTVAQKAIRGIVTAAFVPPQPQQDALDANAFDPLVAGVQALRSTEASSLSRVLTDIISDGEAEIRLKWKKNADDAANRGTWMHLQCELWLNRDGCNTNGPEMQMFFRYMRHLARHRVQTYRTEMEVFAEDMDLAGSVDFVGIVTEGEDKGKLWIVDWKRTRQLRFKDSHRMGHMMAEPLSFIPDSDKWHYALQLNFYAYVIERYYRLPVVRMEVACFHPDNEGTPYFYEVPRMNEVTEYMACHQRRLCADRICLRMKQHLPSGVPAL